MLPHSSEPPASSHKVLVSLSFSTFFYFLTSKMILGVILLHSLATELLIIMSAGELGLYSLIIVLRFSLLELWNY